MGEGGKGIVEWEAEGRRRVNEQRERDRGRWTKARGRGDRSREQTTAKESRSEDDDAAEGAAAARRKQWGTEGRIKNRRIKEASEPSQSPAAELGTTSRGAELPTR